MTENYYNSIEGLRDINLEDSWVLSCNENGNIQFLLEAVLSKSHPSYTLPLVGEANCYKRSRLEFLDVEYRNWLRKDFKPNIGPYGEIDYGNIDTFSRTGPIWYIVGEWGELEVVCREVSFCFLD